MGHNSPIVGQAALPWADMAFPGMLWAECDIPTPEGILKHYAQCITSVLGS